MSDIKKLTDKIIQDAQRKKEIRLNDGLKKLTQQEKFQKNKVERQVEELLQRFEKDVQAELSLKISDLHVKSRSRLLATKQAVLDELFEEALVALRELSPEEFNQFVLSNIQKTHLTGDAEIVMGEDSLHYATKEVVERWQKQTDENLHLLLSETTVPNRGGFLLRQGEVEFNFLFESLVSASEEDLSNQLLELIFEEE